jgi:hypothetical protein
MKAAAKRRIAIGLFLGAAVVAWLLVRLTSEPGIIESHERAWRTAHNQIKAGAWSGKPTTTADYFRPRTWLWYWRGKPTASDLFSTLDRERQELVWLGVFDTENLALTNRIADQNFFNAPAFAEWTSGSNEDIALVAIKQTNRIDLVGKPAAIKELAEAIRAWDAEGRDQTR